jgi:predicted Zn-dependent peptidase
MIHEISKTHSRIATIIVAFNAGARVEEKGGYNPGIAHMLEHSLFKGTAARTAYDIQRQIGFYGGHSNAFTSHEAVAYYISVPYENLEPCMDILSDMIFNPIFPDEDVIREIEVVKEEEMSSLDAVSSYMWNMFSDEFFDNYLSNPVIGTQESISKFTVDEVRRFHAQFCNRKDAIVSICSNLNKKNSKALLNKYFGKASGRTRNPHKFKGSNYLGRRYGELVKGGVEHSYVWLAMPSVPTNSEIDSEIMVLSAVLGRGMDSRLFEEVREKRGLVYSISAGTTDFQGGAASMIEFSTREENITPAIEIVDTELTRIKLDMPSEEEVQRAKNKIKSSFYSAMEDSYSLAFWAIKRRLDGLSSIEDHMKSVEAVTPSGITSAANRIFDQEKQFTVICRGE